MLQLTSSLKDMRDKLDKPVQNLLIKISSNISSFPTKLLYIPKIMSGLGFKIAMVHRAPLQSRAAANITAGMKMGPQRHQHTQWGRYQ